MNRFVATVETCKVRHAISVDGKPMSGVAYQVFAADGTTKIAPAGTTDGDGGVTFEVPVQTGEVVLVFGKRSNVPLRNWSSQSSIVYLAPQGV